MRFSFGQRSIINKDSRKTTRLCRTAYHVCIDLVDDFRAVLPPTTPGDSGLAMVSNGARVELDSNETDTDLIQQVHKEILGLSGLLAL